LLNSDSNRKNCLGERGHFRDPPCQFMCDRQSLFDQQIDDHRPHTR
jgi:hypothetical protein